MSMRERARLTNHGHDAFSCAHDLADQLGHDEVTWLHLAICVVSEGLAVGVLYNLGVPLDDLKREFKSQLPATRIRRSSVRVAPFNEPLEILGTTGHPIPGTTTTPYKYDWTATDEDFIRRAASEAEALGMRFYGTEHLLLAILRDETNAAAQLLMRRGVSFEAARAEILRIHNDGH
jgi:ATP-dependent Clp protease ATP-binding subunit ClpC